MVGARFERQLKETTTKVTKEFSSQKVKFEQQVGIAYSCVAVSRMPCCNCMLIAEPLAALQFSKALNTGDSLATRARSISVGNWTGTGAGPHNRDSKNTPKRWP